MPKRTVFYDATKNVANVAVGLHAVVWPINHTSENVSNNLPVLTSRIMSVGPEYGEFETQNSIYMPHVPGDDQ
jgi:hypothetical protein